MKPSSWKNNNACLMRILFTTMLGSRFVLPALLCLSIGAGASADNIDDYIKQRMQKRQIPGLSLAVIKDGKLVKAKGYGLSNVETNTPATPQTVYKIASISKPFMAAGVMLLMQDGKLSLDDKAGKYLDNAPGSWKDITIRHLLTHTSGLVEDPPGFEPYRPLPDAELIKRAYSRSLLFAAGERWSYSNLGYFVLGEILTRVSGKPWNQFLSERVLQPAGLTATRTTTTTDIVPHRASGYELTRIFGTLRRAEDWVAVRPSGGLLSTVLDLAKWDATLNSDAMLSAASREQMWSPVKLNNGATHPYGLGWFVDQWQGHKRISHQGGLPGFMSDMERFVDDKLTVIVMLNSSSDDPAKIALQVAGFYLPAVAPRIAQPIPDKEPEVTASIKAMLMGLVAGNLDANLLTSQTAAFATRSPLSDDLRTPGPIQSIELVERRNEGEDRIYRYRVKYRDDSLLLTCGFNKSNKIHRLGMQPE